MSDGALEPPPLSLPEEEQFELRLALTPDDRRRFVAQYGRRRFDVLDPFAAVVASFAAGIALWFLAGVGPLAAFAVSIVLSVSGVVLIEWIGVRDVALDSDGWLVQTAHDGLHVTATGGLQRYPWNDFKEMIVSDDAIYLGLEARRALMLPHRVFADRNDFYTFASVVAKYSRI